MKKLLILKLCLLALCAGVLASTPAHASGKLFLTAFNQETKSDTLLYFVKPDGTLWWLPDTIKIRPNNNKETTYSEFYEHKLGTPVQVGVGWETALNVVPGGASTFYAVTRDGLLKWYRHDGLLTGEAKWQGPVTAGEGWNNDKVIPMGGGVLYTLSKNGTLRWHKHKTYKTGFTNYADWVQPSVDVMTGWNQYKMVIGAGNGVFYAVTKEGKLLWWRHVYQTPSPTAYPGPAGNSAVRAAQIAAWARTWKGPAEVGSAGWGEFTKMFSPGNGHIYAVTPEGNLNFYNHTGWQTGEIKWGLANTYPSQEIGQGWGDYLFVFAAMAE